MINFCSCCGAPTKQEIPEQDQRLRAVCSACGYVHYQNPKIVTCTIPLWQGRVLLCLRGIEPRLGYWTLPGGFMENGESCVQSAIRETMEESCVELEAPQLQSIISLPFCNQVHLFYRAQMTNPSWQTTAESTQIQLFSEQDIPWHELAFSSVREALAHHFQVEHGKAPALLDKTISKRLPS